MSAVAYIGLGSNLGDPRAQIEQACNSLANERVRVTALSSLYCSDPVGPIADQPKFFNVAIAVETDLEPQELLGHCLSIEAQLGRRRVRAMGPRVIDIDLLLYDNRVGEWYARDGLPHLRLPHPALVERSFVVAPLVELVPKLKDPRSGKALKKRLPELRAQQNLECVGQLSKDV